MYYLLLKQAHIALALLSVSGFILRWTWRRTGSHLAGARLTRVLPHLIDTLLLLAGVTLAWRLGSLPVPPAWLSVKIGGLIGYILLGSLAMKSAPRSVPAAIGFAAALAVFAWMVSIARTKSPWGFLSAFIV